MWAAAARGGGVQRRRTGWGRTWMLALLQKKFVDACGDNAVAQRTALAPQITLPWAHPESKPNTEPGLARRAVETGAVARALRICAVLVLPFGDVGLR